MPPDGTTGTVHFQQWQGSTWNGGSGGRDGDFEGFGASIDFSATGRYVVIGSPDRTNDDDTLAGQVAILSDGYGGWPQVGADINGAAEDNLGTSVAISDDGQRVVIGSPNDDTNGTNTGTVRVLDWNGSAWTDAETPLNGDTNNERLGAAVSLSGNGDTITASAIPDGTTAPGQVTVHNSDTNPVDPGRPLKLDFQTTYSETGPIQYVGPSCATFADGIARCWGTRTDPWTGQANTNEIPPLEVDLELDAGVTPTSVAVGEYHACFVLSDGDVKCLFNADGDGSVYFAQDGGGGTLTFDSPAVEIDAGYFHTCVLLESGSGLLLGQGRLRPDRRRAPQQWA